MDNLYLAYIRDQRLFRTYYKLVYLVTISPVWEYGFLSLLLPIEILADMFACLPLNFDFFFQWRYIIEAPLAFMSSADDDRHIIFCTMRGNDGNSDPVTKSC